MILDKNLYFGTDLDASQGAGGPTLFGDVIDLGTAAAIRTGLLGGETMYFVVTCTLQIIHAGSPGTISFQLQSGPEAAITTAPTRHCSSMDILTDSAANLATARAAGTPSAQGNYTGGILCCIPIPPGNFQRYLGAFWTVATTTTTAGTVDAFLTKDPTYWRAFTGSPSDGVEFT